jgi:hypothetical protein
MTVSAGVVSATPPRHFEDAPRRAHLDEHVRKRGFLCAAAREIQRAGETALGHVERASSARSPERVDEKLHARRTEHRDGQAPRRIVGDELRRKEQRKHVAALEKSGLQPMNVAERRPS